MRKYDKIIKSKFLLVFSLALITMILFSFAVLADENQSTQDEDKEMTSEDGVMSDEDEVEVNEKVVVSKTKCDSFAEDLISKNLAVPGFLPYRNERFNLEVAGNHEGYIIIEDRRISEIKCNATLEDYTYTLKLIDWYIVDAIEYAKEPLLRLEEALSEKDIEIIGANVIKKLNVFWTKLAVKVGSWFIF